MSFVSLLSALFLLASSADAFTLQQQTCRGCMKMSANIFDISSILTETAVSRITERGATRMDDQTSDASMELRKKEGYF